MHFDRGAAAPLPMRPPARAFLPAYGGDRQAAHSPFPAFDPPFLPNSPRGSARES